MRGNTRDREREREKRPQQSSKRFTMDLWCVCIIMHINVTLIINIVVMSNPFFVVSATESLRNVSHKYELLACHQMKPKQINKLSMI